MNLMNLDGYQATIEYDAELELFRGEILGLTGGADFYGRTPEELRAEFHNSLKVFLEVCQEKGIEPRRSYYDNVKVSELPVLQTRIREARIGCSFIRGA